VEVLNVEKLTPLGSELKRLMSTDGSEIQTVPHLAQALEIPEFDAWGLFDGSTEVDDAMAEKLAATFKTTARYWRVHGWRVWAADWDSSLEPETVQAVDSLELNKRLIAVLASMCATFMADKSGVMRHENQALWPLF
jgi:hypothetical protein